uniref:Low density lipoprotein receptor-related protein 12 n=1 Tax=Hippocampus comes TaxID=109280 RepID=A0A3Q3DLK4_HIPCM
MELKHGERVCVAKYGGLRAFGVGTGAVRCLSGSRFDSCSSFFVFTRLWRAHPVSRASSNAARPARPHPAPLAACGDSSELLRASSGVIASPGWPFRYPALLNCSWNIRGRPGDLVTVSFQDFDLHGSHPCSSDWMSISSYKNLDGLRVCGSSLPPPYISSQDHVWIRFRSDEALTGKGFRLSYVTGRALFLVTGQPDVASCDADQFHCSNGKCIPDRWRCNSMDECGDNSDEDLCADSPFSFQPCGPDQFPCLSRYTRIYTCLPRSLRCDGSIDCQDLGDEIDCLAPTCGERFRNFYGSFSSPNYPDFYPPGSNCTWLIDTGDHRKVVLRFTDFKLDGTGYGDYVKVYDGPEENPQRLLRVLTAFDSRAPVTVVSSSGQLRVHFHADKINAARGFNVTYQVDGFCLPWEVPCGGSWGCYGERQRCDGYWHCPNGRDESNCSACREDEFPCSRNGACYPRSDRCNYQNRCPNGSDEKNCLFCQPGNFHCKNNRCVFESWVCDAQDDCGDGSDEEDCPVVVPTRVITAAVIGSLVCGLLLVIALGCTCKLYSLRMFERRSFETQLSRVEAELLRREAPPSYGQLIAQGLIPPVEDFPICSGSQASVLENLRLAVRSQLGFTSLGLPSAGRRGNLWRGLFNFSRSRRSGSLALNLSGAHEGFVVHLAVIAPHHDLSVGPALVRRQTARVRRRACGGGASPAELSLPDSLQTAAVVGREDPAFSWPGGFFASTNICRYPSGRPSHMRLGRRRAARHRLEAELSRTVFRPQRARPIFTDGPPRPLPRSGTYPACSCFLVSPPAPWPGSPPRRGAPSCRPFRSGCLLSDGAAHSRSTDGVPTGGFVGHFAIGRYPWEAWPRSASRPAGRDLSRRGNR